MRASPYFSIAILIMGISFFTMLFFFTLRRVVHLFNGHLLVLQRLWVLSKADVRDVCRHRLALAPSLLDSPFSLRALLLVVRAITVNVYKFFQEVAR